jgi:hypothetical protein
MLRSTFCRKTGMAFCEKLQNNGRNILIRTLMAEDSSHRTDSERYSASSMHPERCCRVAIPASPYGSILVQLPASPYGSILSLPSSSETGMVSLPASREGCILALPLSSETGMVSQPASREGCILALPASP